MMKRRRPLEQELPLTTTTTPFSASSNATTTTNEGSPRNKPRRRKSRQLQFQILLVTVIITTITCFGIWWTWLRIPFYYLPTITTMDHKQQSQQQQQRPPQLIHIVKTRFMQEQPELMALGHARLAQFRVLCLPTMVQQTALVGNNNNHLLLWMIKVDPNLSREILQPLIELVEPYDFIYIIGSNRNFRINQHFPGAWRDGAEIDEISSCKIYTGDSTTIVAARTWESATPILETRLDADDGLHFQFLETVQTSALALIRDDNGDDDDKIQWMYWCPRRVLEWHVSATHTAGVVIGMNHDHLCVTAGLTTLFGVHVKEEAVPVYPHHELIKALSHDHSCGTDKCIQYVDDLIFSSVRLRSTTSAGMQSVGISEKESVQPFVEAAFWDQLHTSFGISKLSMQILNRYLTDHRKEIARDNLKGQCTTGHSCKDSARQHLESIVKEEE